MSASGLDSFLGEHPKIVEIRKQIARLLERQTDVGRRLPPILIEGETGTGKGLLAAAIHRSGPRSQAPFVDVNCAAIPETLLESELFGFERGAFTGAQQAKAGLLQTAHRGTIFLDEIALMPEALQAKLLKAIEERSVRRLGSIRSEPVDVWIIAAANADLRAAIQAGRFREDLYQRLAVMTVRLPPLRERSGDVLSLAEHFLKAACADYGIPSKRLSDDAGRVLKAYSWPGNVRELANVMERAALLSDAVTITADALQDLHVRSVHVSEPIAAQSGSMDEQVAALERSHLEEALQATNWNISHAAERLGIARNTLRYRMSKHGLTPPSKHAVPRSRPAAAAPSPRSRSIEWERRRITFVQTEIGAGNLEATASDIARLMEEVLGKVQSFGARISELGPTRLISVFGMEPAEDAPSQAAHMAMTAQNVAKRAGSVAKGVCPAVTIAIHIRQCLVGRIGETVEIDTTDRREAQSVLDALITSAHAGSIVVSQAAATFLGARFNLRGADFSAAGESALVLTGLRETDPEVPFVGRRRELAFLENRFEVAQDGQGQLVMLVGEAGIGKSRLVREFRRSLGTRAAWTEGRAVSFGQSMPFHPLIDMLRRSFSIEDSDTDAEIIRKTESVLPEMGERFRPALPFLQYLLSVLPADSHVWTMDPKLRRAQIVDALHQFLIGYSTVRPHVVVIEDLHWIDRATAEFLALLVDSIPTSRVLVILTCRPGFATGFQERTFHTGMTLPGLSSSESAQIASTLLQSQQLPSELRALIDRKAEGNPFFVEEIARSLLETGVVVRNDDGVTLARPLNAIDVPDRIEDVIRARIGRLDEDVRRLLQLASVIGREFSRRLLDRLHDDSERTVEILRELKAAEFIHEKPIPEPVCIFKHALIYQVTYASLGESERREQHRRIGIAIEELYADRRSEHYGVLAHHFSRAEEWVKAIEYLVKAAQQAAQSFATREALNLYDQALAASRRMSEGVRDPSMLIAIHQAKASLFFVTSEFERSREEAEYVLPLARLTGDAVREAEALAAIAWAETWSRKLEQAIAFANQALAVAERAGATAVQARAHFTIGWVRSVTGAADEGQAALHKAIRLSQVAGDAVHHSLSLSAMGLVENWKGDYESAVKVQTEALEIARERNLLVPLLFNFFLRGLTLTSKGDYDEAFSTFHEGLTLSEQAGDEAIHHRLLNSLGWLYSEIGDLERARTLNEQSAAVGRRRGDPGSQPNAEINLGEICLVQGDLVSAEEIFEDVYRYWEAPTTSQWMRFRYSIRLFGDMGEVALAHGDLEKAGAMSSRCLEAASHTKSRKNLVKAYRLKGEIAGARKEWNDAEKYLANALQIARSIGNPPQLWKTHLALGRLYEESGRRELASTAYKDARRVVDDVQASLQQEDLRASFERAAFVQKIRSLT
jgi:DNA-binding NtrC family response regulator/tetratricopeptide (TPR) repeat protein